MSFKQQLENFLAEISKDAKFPVFNYKSSENYTIVIKCRVERDRDAQFYSDYSKEWIRKFSKFTRTAWIVRQCFPKMKRMLYRKTYVCHLSHFNKVKSASRPSAKNRDCKAKIDFKIRFINRNTIRNDQSLREGLNLTISIDFTHSHGVKTSEAYSLMTSIPDIDEIFNKYFLEGHTPASANTYHDLLLLSKYGARNVLDKELKPTLHHIHYISKKIKAIQSISDTLAEKKKLLEESGGVLNYTDDYSIIMVITPFMKNVLSGHDLDYIVIDSTSIKEYVVSFFYVASPLGALPIACAIHSQTTEASFSQAFFSTKLLIEHQTLKSFEPKSILINAIEEQKHALEAIFSNEIVFTSRASVTEEIWKILCSDENRLKNQHKLMVLFYLLIYSKNEKEAEKYYKELENDKGLENAPKVKEYLTKIWDKRKEFLEQSQNKILDISVRTIRQFLLNKCNSFSSVIMIDVLLNIVDQHWCQILHSLLKGKQIMETLTKFLSKDSAVLEMLDGTTTEYRLITDRKTRKNVIVNFRSDTLFCDCLKGRRAQLCEHLCAVLHSIDIHIDFPEDKISFYTALAGDESKEEIIKAEPEFDDQELDGNGHQDDDDGAMEELEPDSQTDDYYCAIKQEVEDKSDPLDSEHDFGNNTEENVLLIQNNFTNNTENNVNSIKKSYENALKALNDEFRRLNIVFRDNPNASNLDTMGRLARELSKIRPVQRLNLSNLYVEVNNKMDCNE